MSPATTRVVERRDYPSRSTNYADSEQWIASSETEKKKRTGTKALSKVRSNNELDRPRWGMYEISSPPAATPLVIATRLSILLEYAGYNKRSSVLFKEWARSDCSSIATCVDLVVGNCQLERTFFTTSLEIEHLTIIGDVSAEKYLMREWEFTWMASDRKFHGFLYQISIRFRIFI